MIAQGAALMRMRLHLGIVTVADVVEWADDLIGKVDEPSGPLLDLSLSDNRKPVEVASLLGDLSSGANEAEASAAAFRQFAISRFAEVTEGKIKPDDLAHGLYEIAWQSSIELPDEYAEFCSWVDDEFDLVRQGTKDRASAEQALADFVDSLGGGADA